MVLMTNLTRKYYLVKYGLTAAPSPRAATPGATLRRLRRDAGATGSA